LAHGLANGIGRGPTEFYVLRPGDRVLGDYIWHFVRQRRFREAAQRSFTGTAGQQRVPRSFVENARVPLPPLDEQRRIVDILNRAARIEALLGGEHVNSTEDRAALHSALRYRGEGPYPSAHRDVMPQVRDVQERMRAFCAALHPA